ncbi:MAG: helix-turn-helix domain-containing protein [Bacteroidales bacterium]|nr:helix-turn-helix domain-containing protein [Bacteroidales bacterium]
MVEISSEEQYEKVMERIEELLPMVDNDTPLNDKHMIELELLSLLVEAYEQKHYPIEPPTLTEMIRLRMAEMGLSQKGLAKLLGVSPPRISEYMTGKSEPTLKVARLMHQKLDIDAEILLG